MMPAVGWLFHGDPETYLYIPASLERYPAQRGVESLMLESGFTNVRYENRLLGTMGLNVGEAPEPPLSS
jgi:demethylmenaquinone methyltransferase/2-methoxy-6-polyprenyl-1,4-benzoquinol methylase